MKTLIALVLVAICTTTCHAVQKYNPFTDEWVTVPSNAQIQYDPMNDSFNYHQPRARQDYNPFINKWEWNDGMNNTNRGETNGEY